MTRRGKTRTARVVRRLVGALVVIVGVTFLAYLLSYLSPTDPATRFFTDHGVVPTAAEPSAKRHQLGVDAQTLAQYAS